MRAWLFAVARRRAVSAFHARRTDRDLDDADLDAMAEAGPGPEQVALARHELAAVAAAIGCLPAHHREVVVLACVEQLSGPQISELLGIPAGTVKSRLSLARKNLARLLEQEGERA